MAKAKCASLQEPRLCTFGLEVSAPENVEYEVPKAHSDGQPLQRCDWSACNEQNNTCTPLADQEFGSRAQGLKCGSHLQKLVWTAN